MSPEKEEKKVLSRREALKRCAMLGAGVAVIAMSRSGFASDSGSSSYSSTEAGSYSPTKQRDYSPKRYASTSSYSYEYGATTYTSGPRFYYSN